MMSDEQLNNAQSSVVPAPQNDISKTTIVVLVLVTLMISMIGTWTVLNELSTVKVSQPAPTSSGKVSLNVMPPDTSNQGTVDTTGKVALEIVR